MCSVTWISRTDRESAVTFDELLDVFCYTPFGHKYVNNPIQKTSMEFLGRWGVVNHYSKSFLEEAGEVEPVSQSGKQVFYLYTFAIKIFLYIYIYLYLSIYLNLY